MAKEATLQVRMDETLKEQAEQLYHNLGTSLAEAVRMFARQSVLENAMPFTIHVPTAASQQITEKRIGVAKGKFTVPDNIDECNDEIAQMFGVE